MYPMKRRSVAQSGTEMRAAAAAAAPIVSSKSPASPRPGGSRVTGMARRGLRVQGR
jgi:hypothetical protein